MVRDGEKFFNRAIRRLIFKDQRRTGLFILYTLNVFFFFFYNKKNFNKKDE